MVVWLSAVADGIPVQPWGGAYLEHHPAFETVATSAASVTVWVHFLFLVLLMLHAPVAAPRARHLGTDPPRRARPGVDPPDVPNCRACRVCRV